MFAIAADNYVNEILGLNKYGSFKSNKRIVKHLIQEFGHKRVQSVTRQDIQRYIGKLNETMGTEYLRHHLSTFRGIMEYADDDWVMPRVKLPKRIKPKQDFYSFEEARKLMEITSGQDKVLVMVLAETGCRLGEALALTPDDIKPYEVNITRNVYEGFVQDTPKTDSSIRKVTISERLYNQILTLKRKQNEFIFQSKTGRPEWPQILSVRFREICDKHSVEYKGFHAFRRGNITELCTVIGIPERIVGVRVGHLSSGTTLGVYCKTLPGCDKIWIPEIEKRLYLTEDKRNDSVIREEINGITDN